MVEVEDFEETLAARLRSWGRERLVSALVQAELAKYGRIDLYTLEDIEDVTRWQYSDYVLDELVDEVIEAIEDTNDGEGGDVFIDATGLYRVALPACPISQAPCADYRESCACVGCCWVKA